MKVSEKTAREHLRSVKDPELQLSIVDLGLVYKITIKGGKIQILMTLTTIGCPLFSVIEADVKSVLEKIGFKKENIMIQLTFDPPWSFEHLSDDAKAQLGIL